MDVGKFTITAAEEQMVKEKTSILEICSNFWDLVGLIEKDVQPFNYPIGEIVELFNGEDNTARGQDS